MRRPLPLTMQAARGRRVIARNLGNTLGSSLERYDVHRGHGRGPPSCSAAGHRKAASGKDGGAAHRGGAIRSRMRRLLFAGHHRRRPKAERRRQLRARAVQRPTKYVFVGLLKEPAQCSPWYRH